MNTNPVVEKSHSSNTCCNGTAQLVVAYHLVVRYLPLLVPCDGSKLVNAPSAVVAPVPPFATAKVPPISSTPAGLAELIGLAPEVTVHVSPMPVATASCTADVTVPVAAFCHEGNVTTSYS